MILIKSIVIRVSDLERCETMKIIVTVVGHIGRTLFGRELFDLFD